MWKPENATNILGISLLVIHKLSGKCGVETTRQRDASAFEHFVMCEPNLPFAVFGAFLVPHDFLHLGLDSRIIEVRYASGTVPVSNDFI